MFKIDNEQNRADLQRCVQYAWNQLYPYRARRKLLYDIYRGEGETANTLGILPINSTDAKYGTLLNMFQDFVRVHLRTLAFSNPKYAVRGRTEPARSIAKQIEMFLDRYSELLNLQNLLEELALDSAFGRCCAKVVTSEAPLGVNLSVAPRVFRVDPNNLILDQRAASITLSQYIGDAYFVDLEVAKNFEGYDRELREKITPWTTGGTNDFSRDNQANKDLYISDIARMVDIFVASPNGGTLYTWAVTNDTFAEIKQKPLAAIPYSFNPYCELSLLKMPSSLEEISRLGSLRGLHLAGNDLTVKALKQALASRYNPVTDVGKEEDMQGLLDSPDREGVMLNDKASLSAFAVPGADAGLVNMANQFHSQFSSAGGSLELALGQSAMAGTASQSKLLAGQVAAHQSADRAAFEMFVASIGKKLAALAFTNEALQIETAMRVPGTKYYIDMTWTRDTFPMPNGIQDFQFEVAPYSMTFRDPQTRIAQLDAASKMLGQWMMFAAQGAPVNLAAVTRDIGESFDLLPDLTEWWSGEVPQPPEQGGNAPYTSMSSPSGQSEVNYNSNAQGGGESTFEGSPQVGGYVETGVE